jgi:hypothetical protein
MTALCGTNPASPAMWTDTQGAQFAHYAFHGASSVRQLARDELPCRELPADVCFG